MELLFDYCSQPVCWMDGKTAFSREGRPLAFVDRGAVFSADNCRYLGQFDRGVFRDRLGCVVAFPRNVWWAKIPLPFQETWTPPVQTEFLPPHIRREARPTCLVMPSPRRSNLTWERYLLGCEAKQFWKTRA